MKKILASILTLAVLMSMVLSVSAAEAKTKTFKFSKDYNGDGKKDYTFTISKVVTTEEGKAKTEKLKSPKVSIPKNLFTSGQLTHSGGNVSFYVVKEGSTIDLTGSAFINGNRHDDIYKLDKQEDNTFKYGTLTKAPYKKLADPMEDLIASMNAGYTEFNLTEENVTEQTMKSVNWGVRGEGSKIVMLQEGYYVLNILAPTEGSLRNPIPTDITIPAVTEKALEASCVFIHVVK